ncbi:MAG: 3'(2'),5'-bisphosphate nucleotidase CysQ [Oceanicaulis sp.]
MTRDDLAFAFAELCLKAAVPVMEVYATDFTPEQKADRSPVTEADRRAEAVILAGLEDLMPGVPVLAEESFEAGVRPRTGDKFLLVDPVDGTKEFIAKNGEFTLNIALIEDGAPTAGCVYAPALGELFVGAGAAYKAAATPGGALERTALSQIATRAAPADGRVAIASRSHRDARTDAFLAEQGIEHTIAAGSSLKFCRLAEGSADVYPRFAPTMEWDTAAGHAVLAAAGGRVETPEGAPFGYGKSEAGYKNGHFIAWA